MYANMTIAGNLIADPVFKQYPNGTSVLTVPVSTVINGYTDKNTNQWVEQTAVFYLQLLGPSAENVHRSGMLKKGFAIFAQVCHHMRKYTDKDGSVKYSPDYRITHFRPMGKPKSYYEGNTQQQAPMNPMDIPTEFEEESPF